MEEWRDIPGWEGFYQASSEGRIRSLDRTVMRRCRWGGDPIPHIYKGRIMRLTPYRGGYLQIGLRRTRETIKHVKVHHLVLEAFGFLRPDDGECRHLNGVRDDNRIENLAWGTHAENEADKDLHGTRCMGIMHGSSKLNDSQVIEIRERYASGEMSHASLGRLYGVSGSAVLHIVTGKKWAHVGGPTTKGKRFGEKLTEADKVKILEALQEGGKSQREIGESFGVSQSMVYWIKKRHEVKCQNIETAHRKTAIAT